MTAKEQNVTRPLIVKSALTLVLLAALGLANYLILRAQIQSQKSLTAVVNISGRQRALLHQSAFLARQLVISAAAEERQQVRRELLRTLEPLEETHHRLIRRDSLSSGEAPLDVQAIYYDSPWLLDTEMRNYIAQIQALAKTPASELHVDNSHFRYITKAAMSNLVDALDQVVAVYQQASQATSDRLHMLSLWSLASTLVMLSLMGWLVFRPMLHRIQQDMDQLQLINETLEQRVFERSALAQQRAEELASSEAALRQQTATLRQMNTVLANALEGIGEVDGEGRYTAANNAYADMLGYSPQDLIGRPWLDDVDPLDRAEAARACRALKTAHNHKMEIEAKVTRRDGKSILADFSLLKASDHNGHARGHYIFAKDITERKQAEQRLVQAERLAAIGRMVTGVAHESRNALQQIQACSRLLEWQLQDNQQARELIADVQKAQHRLHRLFEELRQFASPLHMDLRCCDLRDLTAGAWSALAQLRDGKDAALHESTCTADHRCEADPFQLEQVVRNVLENALAACSDPIRIEVSYEDATLSDREALRISISDNGPGLSAEQNEKIFQAFYTTKTQGSGLGMAIAKRIVEAHHGRIEVGNHRRVGTEIVITLPRIHR